MTWTLCLTYDHRLVDGTGGTLTRGPRHKLENWDESTYLVKLVSKHAAPGTKETSLFRLAVDRQHELVAPF